MLYIPKSHFATPNWNWKVGVNHLDGPFHFWNKLLSDAVCDRIISLGESKESKPGTVMAPSSVQVDASVRDTEVTWLRPDDCSWLYDIVWKAVSKNIWDYDIRGFGDNLQYTVYRGDGNHFYDWHHDIGTESNHRKISFTLALSNSDEYAGGDFGMQGPEGPLPVPPLEKGAALMFPSFMRHRVAPVTEGVRRSLVAWIAGPKFR